MPIIDSKKLPKIITDKYSIVSNAFRLDKIVNAEKDKYKNEPKDEINIEVGDTKQTEFYPQIKLQRWTNEVNFSIRLKDTEYERATVKTEGDKIVWDKDNVKIEMHDFVEGEGGYKFVWYLKEKPLTNKLEFTIQSKGFDFFYQPELTPEEIAEGAFRPENVVGSYAVYHSTKGRLNDVYGKEYKVGKAFHIYRPHIIDAEGKETWGILHIENGIYSVEIPQDFLDTAVYPIKSNDTFGFTGVGGTAADSDVRSGSKFSTTESGTVTSVSNYIKASAGTVQLALAIYSDSSGSPNALLAEDSGNSTVDTTAAWRTNNLSLSVSASAAYWLIRWVGVTTNTASYYYDAGETNQRAFNASGTFETWPDPFGAPTFSARKVSIYATYTASASSAIKTINALAKASVKTVNGLAIASVKTINGLS